MSSLKIVVSYAFIVSSIGCKQKCFDELHEGKTYSTEVEGNHLTPIEEGKQPAVVYHSLFAPAEASMAACISAGFPTGTTLCEDRFAVELKPVPTR